MAMKIVFFYGKLNKNNNDYFCRITIEEEPKLVLVNRIKLELTIFLIFIKNIGCNWFARFL